MNREIQYDEVFDAQTHYRILLDSMARPGKINLLKAASVSSREGINHASVLVAFTLLNADTSFCVLGSDRNDISRYLLINTSSHPVPYPTADFIFLSGNREGKEIGEVKTGTLPYPEEGATLVIDTEEISDHPLDGSVEFTLKGPGVEGEKKIYVRGLNMELPEAVKEQNLEFPLGIDMILTDKDHRLICIPRSNRFSATINN